MVISLGRAINITNVAQTLGRPTGNGRSVLKENGFDSVTVLTTSNDLTICIKMQNYITKKKRCVNNVMEYSVDYNNEQNFGN
jgi:hypothetical protein